MLQIANITKDRPELFHLLDEAYADIYLPAFPDPKERESLEKFKKAINGDYDKVHAVINILGENLEDPEKYVIKGISVAYYFEQQNVGLLAYNAISPDHREAGLGKLMVQSRIESLQNLARTKGAELGGVFIECNDPFKVTPDMDSMDPAKRVKIFEAWGARKIPVDYVQPPLSSDGFYCDTLLLLNYPVDGKYADKTVVESFLRGIYRDYRAEQVMLGEEKVIRVIRADDDHYFKQMMKQLAALEIETPKAPPVPGYKTNVPKFNFFK